MTNWGFLNKHRLNYGSMFSSTPEDGFNGLFMFRVNGENRPVRVIASDGLGWQHVSVSHGNTEKDIPTWRTMCAVKDLFWNEEEAVIQIHPKKSEYVNFNPGVLHLWRCTDGREQPLPPSFMVGPK